MDDAARQSLIAALPYGRRYARALVGDQAQGDALVAAALRSLMAQGDLPLGGRLGLYAAINAEDRSDPGAGLTADERRILLLTALEELRLPQAAAVLGLEEADAKALQARAQDHLKRTAATDVLIIEDEPIIAMDIEDLVRRCGHRVIGTAASETEAIDMAKEGRPGLILADINLGEGGDGITAVARILAETRNATVPVIFVTAYPERLLTGERVEPTFVIPKPFEPTALAIATYQAVRGPARL
jgi:CheY-like chemotaxis protein